MGRMAPVVGWGIIAVDVATSPTPGRTFAGDMGGVAGGYAGGVAGAEGGPPGVIAGSLAGSVAGQQFGERAYDGTLLPPPGKIEDETATPLGPGEL